MGNWARKNRTTKRASSLSHFCVSCVSLCIHLCSCFSQPPITGIAQTIQPFSSPSPTFDFPILIFDFLTLFILISSSLLCFFYPSGLPSYPSMLVANSFDLWKKDGFFSAAEQVQESADTYVFYSLFDLGIFPFLFFLSMFN